MRALVTAIGVLVAAAGGACAAPGEGPLAKIPTVSEATGLTTCRAATDPLHPLIVEWEAASRAELEATAARGPVIVRYAGCELRVMSACRVRDAARYEVVRTTPAEDRIDLSTTADLYARLPLGVARLEGKLAESGGLSLRYVAVGERVLSRSPSVVEGECEGATHYVDAMVLGAFDLETRAQRSGSAAVSAPFAAAGGGVETRRELAGSAGDVARCRERGLDATTSCQAVLQLGLRPLVSVGDVLVEPPPRPGTPGISARTVIPALGNLETLLPATAAAAGARTAGVLDDVDVKLLELLGRARTLDADGEAATRAKASAWGALARHGGPNPYRAVAERRRDEWIRIAAAQDEHLERVRKSCPSYLADKQRLDRLLVLDGAVLGRDARHDAEEAFERTYGRWRTELATCASSRPAISGASDGTAAIPGGTFEMGGARDRIGYLNYEARGDDTPLHVVAVAPFAMDVTEVTVAAYRRCVQAHACSAPLGPRPTECTWRGRHDDVPVNCVDRDQARTYCQWAGKRLPTEEEWEYAARPAAGTDPYPWGAAPKSSDDFPKLACWGRDVHAPCPVGSHPGGASPFGLLDMAGNVWEWTDSVYSADYTRRLVSDEAVIRGGAFSTPVSEMLQVTYRGSLDPRRRVGWVGFRCAR